MPKLLPSKVLPAPPWAARRAGDDYGAPAEPDWRDIDWRPHLRQLEIEGRLANYLDIGDGAAGREPVVLVHGLAGNWQNWLENIPRLVAEGRRVVAPDLPGHGYSEMPAEEISISRYGRFVNALCDKLDLGEVVLIGNSMGGFTAAETAIQFPERVARLVLVSAAGLSSANVFRRPIMTGARLGNVFVVRSAAMSDKLVTRPRLRIGWSHVVRHPSRIPSDLLYELTRGAAAPGFMDALEANLTYDFRDRLTEIGCPTLIVQGAKDMIVPQMDAKEYEELIPDSRRIVFEDTGHLSMFERPQTFNDTVVEFLAAEPTAPKSEAEVGAPASVDGAVRGSSNGGASDADRDGDARVVGGADDDALTSGAAT